MTTQRDRVRMLPRATWAVLLLIIVAQGWAGGLIGHWSHNEPYGEAADMAGPPYSNSLNVPASGAY